MDDVKALRADLEELVLMEKIPIMELESVKSSLKSKDVKEYIEAIVERAKPEESLRQNFFYKDAPIMKLLGVRGSPEVKVGTGYVDLVLKDSLGRKIIVEFKRLFELRRNKLVRNELNWEEYEEQIKRYVFSEEARFVVLTNLYEWYFFSSKTIVRKFKPFHQTPFSDLVDDLESYGGLYELLERREYNIKKGELDEHFFESLREWIKILDGVEFEADEREKMHIILHLINKFIFIQTLDDYGVIDFNWLYKKWTNFYDRIQLAEKHKEKPKVAGRYYKSFIRKFLEEINDFFYPLYDTELFSDDILEKVKDEPENWARFYSALATVLGFMPWQEAGLRMGITQYDYSQIDEDILGKAYETYLAEKRKEKGIYYTPKYVTQFIVEETLGNRLKELKRGITQAIRDNDFETAEKLSRELFEIRVADFASGSGSFLIKVLRAFWDVYSAVIETLREKEDKLVGRKTRDLSALVQKKEILDGIVRMRKLFPGDERILMSQMVLRHVFAVDLDENAVEVAKMNLWREMIKLNPKAFRWDSLGENEHVLPNLSLNLIGGDSLMGFSDSDVLEGKEEVKRLLGLWEEFIENPENLGVLEEIREIKGSLREELDERYRELLKEKLGDNAKKLNHRFVHHPLDFFMAFFNPDGSIRRGFDFIVGNPPYVRIQNLKKESPEYVEFLNRFYESAVGEYDLALPFIERGYTLLNESGELAFIVTKMWIKLDYGEKLREIISREKAIRLLLDFGHNQVFENPLAETSDSKTKSPITYTMILILTKEQSQVVRYGRVLRLQKTLDQINAIHNPEQARRFELWVADFPADSLSSDPWVFLTDEEKAIVDKIHRNAPALGTVAVIFQGLRTSGDKVYILQKLQDLGNAYKVYSKALDQEIVLEKDLLRPVLRGRGIKKWLVYDTPELILFPYEIRIEGKQRKAVLIEAEKLEEAYPRTWKYLLLNKERLEARENEKWKNSPKWYEFGRIQNLEKMDLPKLLNPDVQNVPTFALDAEGKYYFTGGYGTTIRDEYRDKISLPYLVGLLNSSLLDWRLKQISKER
ncbi:Eco57I restriction-modification methylase domain-containing protein, partial [Thermococcus sp.]